MTSRIVLGSSLFLGIACGGSRADATAGGTTGTMETGSSGAGAETSGSSVGPSTSMSGESESGGVEVDPAPTQEVEYAPSDADILNPERGFYRAVNLVGATNLSWVREGGETLVYSYVRLDDHRTEAIPQSLLDQVEVGLQVARDAGLGVLLRFAYNFGPYPDSEPDAPLEWVSTHIEQVTPLLEANADVITILQAGFIGAWGEWHTSTNGLLDHRQEILDAILDGLPAERMTQLRYPRHKEERFGEPLTAAQAFGGSAAARVGHHNDCFLASDTDMGTYPTGQAEQWKVYLEADTLFVPMGGETCAVNPPRSECGTALEEMERLHYSYINHDYHQGVVAAWQAGGCYEEMRRRLGYRFVLVKAELAPAARPGGWFPLSIELTNVGWASPFNPRPVRLVLEGADGRFETEVATDPRLWLAGATQRIEGELWLPSDANVGEYTLSLALPSADPTLEADDAYAIRFANEGIWDAGLNVLASIFLDHDAPGGARASQPFELNGG